MRRISGGSLIIILLLMGAGFVLADRLGYIDRLELRVRRTFPGKVRLSAGDFPAGVAAPVGELASVPLRPMLIGFTPRGSSSALLLATGGVQGREGPARIKGIFRTAYALDARAVPFEVDEELRKALARGAENGGVDLAIVSVDRLAAWSGALRDAAPRTVMLVGRSRGQEALGVVGISQLADLKGKRLGVYSQSPGHYFALWLLSRARLNLSDVTWVELKSMTDAGAALREGRADAVVGFRGDVELAAKDRGGELLASTADAPHLIASVLVSRGDFAARYPDAIRRALRGLLDAGEAVLKDPSEGALMLGELLPALGDPVEAIKSAPPATLKDNLAFFGLAGEAPVTYDELFQSASELAQKTGRIMSTLAAEDTRDLGALKYVSEARAP